MVRLLRYLVGLIIAVILLILILPHVGVPTTRFVPPPWLYQQAGSLTPGQVTNKRDEQTNDPFQIGKRLYFLDYTFDAPPIDQPDSKKTVSYNGEVRCDEDMYQHFEVRNQIEVKYLKSYPWINGVEEKRYLGPGDVVSGPGLGCGEGSNILSGWLIWVGVALVAGYLVMVVIDQFARKQDI
jgi:hypothetical protein